MHFTLTSAFIFASCLIASLSAKEQVSVDKRSILLLPELDNLKFTSLTTGSDDQFTNLLTDSLLDTEAKKKKRSLKTKRGILAIDKLLADLPLVNSKTAQPQQVKPETYNGENEDANQAQEIDDIDEDVDVDEDNEEEQAEPLAEAQPKNAVKPQGNLIGQLISLDVLDGLSAQPAEKTNETPE